MTTGRDRFWRDSLDASAPLILWALHFFIVYILVAASCVSEADAQHTTIVPGNDVVVVVLQAITVCALLIAAWLVWRAIALYRLASSQLLALARLWCAALAAIGMTWTAVPLFILSTCPS